MQYIGGKQKSGGQHIAALIKQYARALQTTHVDERMCGGLSVTARLRGYDVVAADACEPLIKYVPAATAARDSLKRKLSHCTKVEFFARDFAEAEPCGVVYADKPYVDSMDYPAVGTFDHERFWAWAETVSLKMPVLVSERVAPEGWVVLWEKSLQSRLATQTNTRRVERVFVHERWEPFKD